MKPPAVHSGDHSSSSRTSGSGKPSHERMYAQLGPASASIHDTSTKSWAHAPRATSSAGRRWSGAWFSHCTIDEHPTDPIHSHLSSVVDTRHVLANFEQPVGACDPGPRIFVAGPSRDRPTDALHDRRREAIHGAAVSTSSAAHRTK